MFHKALPCDINVLITHWSLSRITERSKQAWPAGSYIKWACYVSGIKNLGWANYSWGHVFINDALTFTLIKTMLVAEREMFISAPSIRLKDTSEEGINEKYMHLAATSKLKCATFCQWESKFMSQLLVFNLCACHIQNEFWKNPITILQELCRLQGFIKLVWMAIHKNIIRSDTNNTGTTLLLYMNAKW